MYRSEKLSSELLFLEIARADAHSLFPEPPTCIAFLELVEGKKERVVWPQAAGCDSIVLTKLKLRDAHLNKKIFSHSRDSWGSPLLSRTLKTSPDVN